jgi:hypothetical protein
VVQAADLGELHDLPRGWELDRSEVGCVLGEREMGARLMVVREVSDQDAAEVALAEHEYVVQALAPDRADEALCERVLPRAVRGRENLLDTHAFHAMSELLTVGSVMIAQEIGGRGLVREGVDELLDGPLGRGCSVTLKWTTRRRW